MNRKELIVKDELQVILLLDNSGSMNGTKIAQVNSAIPALKNHLVKLADSEGVKLRLRIISFSDTAEWKVGKIEQGEDIENVVWNDLKTEGGTNTPAAILEANKALRKEFMGSHALKPIVILVTDGYCTSEHAQYTRAIQEMKKRLAGRTGKEKVTRIAIGVGDYNKNELIEFASEGFISDQLQPLIFEIQDANNLGKVINWVTVTSIISSIMDEDVVDMGDPDWGEDDKD